LKKEGWRIALYTEQSAIPHEEPEAGKKFIIAGRALCLLKGRWK
jgi:hypothetical protein